MCRSRHRRLSATVTLADVRSPFVATMDADDPVVDVQSADGLDTAAMLRAGADAAIGTQRPQQPFQARELADLPVWAYVPSVIRGARAMPCLLRTARPRPNTASLNLHSARGTGWGGLLLRALVRFLRRAACGRIAQALAVTGRGVALVSDEPRFDLVPLRIDANSTPLSIRLVAVWDPRGAAGASIEGFVARLALWVSEHYG